MRTSDRADHRAMAATLRQRVETAPGLTPKELRCAALKRSAGGAPLASPYDALTAQIGSAFYRVTDAQVSATRAALGSDKATIELVMAACVGAAMLRFERAVQAIEGTSDAPSRD